MSVPEDYRAQSRARWSRTARGWEELAELQRRVTMPVSAWMVDALEPQAGQDLLELAAGPGDTGFLAAELVQPGGTLICSDFVPEMLSVAQRRAEALGVRNVRFRQIDAETSIDLPAASQDGVLCRWGYMLMADPEAALRETRRVLKPGARVALAAWASPEANPWSVLPSRELAARGLVEEPPAGGPGQFAWAAEGAIAEHLAAAGFTDPVLDAVDFAYRFPSAAGWWKAQKGLSVRVRDAAARMDAATEASVVAALERMGAAYAAPGGGLSLPARTWVAAASA